jgi:chorismate-pyruvate lyase
MSRDYIFIDDPIVTLKKPRHWWQFRLKKADKRLYRELLLYGEAQIPVSGISGEPPE